MTNPVIIQTTDLEGTFQALRHGDPLKDLQPPPSGITSRGVPERNYATTTSVNTGSWGAGPNPMLKMASSNAGIIYGQPQFFSPVHTPIN